MNYKGLFHQIWTLLSAPGKAWDEIREHGGAHDIQAGFVYPLIGLCGLSEFIGVFIGREFSSLMFQVALTRCCAVAVALFGGFFLSAYVLDKLAVHWLKAGSMRGKMQVFTGYSMVVTFVLTIVSGLFSIALASLDIAGVHRLCGVRGRAPLAYAFASLADTVYACGYIGYPVLPDADRICV